MDTVFPARLWDQSKDIQDIFMDTTFRFDDVLDASKLKAALQELLKLGEWRKVGSRLRKNVRGSHHLLFEVISDATARRYVTNVY